MRKSLLLTIFYATFCCSGFLAAQTKFQRVFGGVDSTQDGLDIRQTTDGGYILNARVTTIKSSVDCENAYVLKTDAMGILQWSKTHKGTNCEEGRAIVQTTDGGYFYAGETKTWSLGGNNNFDVFATKMDAAGNMQWTRNYGDGWDDGVYAVEQNSSGDYVCFGMSSNLATNGYSDFYILKLSNAGNIQWSKTYGGTYFDWGYDGTLTNDGGYIMCGSTYPSQIGGGGTHFYIVKADMNGTFQWGRLVNGIGDDFARSVIQTNDGGYLAVGGTQSFGSGNTDVFLVKTASDGTVSWTKTYGGFNNDCGFTVKQTSDGNYAICGGTNSVGNGGYDLFLLKTNQNGNLLWTKTYGGSLDEGPSGGMFFLFNNSDRDVSMVNTSDGGFAITSMTNSFGNGHVYLVKTDANGSSGCNETNGPFLETTPTPSVSVNGAQTNPTQVMGVPNPVVNAPSSIDTNVCCGTPQAQASNNVTICQSASTTLSASGGTNYSWSSGQTTSVISVSPAVTTTFIVTVSDSCGNDKDTVVVTVNSLPTSNAGNDVTICPGANVTLSGTGSGNTYVWNPGGQSTTSISVSPTITSTYTFTSSNSCGTSSDLVTITISNSIAASVAGNLTICPGGSSTLTASGGSTYAWSNGSSANVIVVSPSASTTYSVIASSGTCSDTVAVNVTLSGAPIATVAGSSTICLGQSATLTASGGTNYSWNTGASTSAVTVSPTNTSTYSVIVSNGGCSDTGSATVTVTPNIIFSVTPAAICIGDSAVVSATGGGTYLWNTGASTSAIIVTPTTTTSYTVQVSNGICTGTAVATVNVTGAITAAITGNTTICSGSSTTLTASGGSAFVWSNGNTTSSITVNPAVSSSYSVIVSSGGCSDTAGINVNINPAINTAIPSYTVCTGNSVTLNYTVSGGTPGYTYSWNTGPVTSSISVNPTITTNYTVTITDAIGCSKAFSIPVTVFAKPTIGISGNTVLCIGDATTLSASGGNSYSWNTGASATSIIVSPSASTNYSVTATSAAGCTSTATVTTTVLPPPVAGITGNDTICTGNSALLNGSGSGNYLWNTGQTSTSISVSPTTSTNYSLVVTVGSCADTANYSVTVIPNPTANAGSNISIAQGQTVTLSASGGGTYQWNNGMTGQIISVSPSVTTQYCVVVTDASGCKDSSCVTVYVEPIDCFSAGELYLPNAFSPNGDNENEVLQIFYSNMSCIKSFKLILYNRWGEKVFETGNALFVWDGVYEGKKLSTAVFTYYMEVQYANTPVGFISNPTIRKGNISLIR